MSPHTREFLPEEAASLFAALGDPTRLSLLGRLQDGQPHAIVELTEGTGLTRQAISKHLGVLLDAGLVINQRAGRENHYLFHPEGIRNAQNYLQQASAQWDEAMLRLKAFVETDGAT